MAIIRHKHDKKIIESLLKDKITDYSLVIKGYVNNVYLFNYKQMVYSAKIPRHKVNHWPSESAIVKKLFKKSWTDPTRGVVIRPWINGSTIEVWDKAKLASVETQIRKLQRVKVPRLIKHNWFLYDEYSKHLLIEDYHTYKKLVKKYSKDKLVVSHNDIHRKNVIWDGRRIHLIDYEWVNLNNKYFDYAAFYVAEGIKLKTQNKTKLNNMIFMATVYFYLWTFSMPMSKKISKLKRHYRKLLKHKPWLK